MIKNKILLEEFEIILRRGHAFIEEAFHEWAKRQQICPAYKKRI